jgi:hypothetical protein
MLRLICFCFLLVGTVFGEIREIYRTIPDIRHPSMRDWVRLQEYLAHGERNELRLLDKAIDPGGPLYDYRCRAWRFRLIGQHFWDRPEFKIIPIHCSMEDKSACVICYASFNQHYPRSVGLLRDQLEKTGFHGHFIYRIGGWPDLEEGSLTLAHVPYAFKPCFFREVQRLGYKNALWLDSSIRPMQALDEVFEKIEKQGYFFYPTGMNIAPFCSLEAAESFGVTAEEARKIPSISAGIVGLSLAHPKGIEALSRWMDAARKETGFLSPRPDQNSLSIIAYLLGLTEWESGETISFQKESIGPKTRFFIDYLSVQ